MPIPKRGMGWIIMSAVLVGSIRNVVTTILVTPATILRTRLRLQPVSRTTRQEWQYLSLRTTASQWISTETVLPAVLRYAVFDLLRGLLDWSEPLPTVISVDNLSEVMTRSLNLLCQSSLTTAIGGLLSFPFRRCQELSAVNMKPLEDPSIELHKYHGFADEIVKDSAWTGLYAGMQEILVGLSPNLVLIPLHMYILRRITTAHKSNN